MLNRILLVALLANICLIASATGDDDDDAEYDDAPKCGPLEVPNSCINGGCYKERNCTDISKPPICRDPIKCRAGCLCKPGYLRTASGKCVLRNECPEKKKCPRQNEVYYSCIQDCPPNTCESLNRTYHCPNQSADKKCKGGCACEPGFYRNKIGDCISEEQCKRCTGPNEYFSCGGACDNVCVTLSRQNQTSCPEVNIKCNDMCYCFEGHARNDKNICVPFNQCPRNEVKCGKNEVLNQCPALYCNPRTCDQKGTKPVCPRMSPGLPCPGKPGCLCKSGYLRDTGTGLCIPEKECPPKCGINEEYSTCINGNCFGARTCKEKGAPVKCVKLDPKDCIKGCKCKDGYVKGDDGTCISEDQCPKTCDDDDDGNSGPSNNGDLQQLSAGIATFTTSFVKETVQYKDNVKKNSAMSAFSVLIFLAQLALYSKGESHKQLLNAINLSTNDQIRRTFKTYIEGTKNHENLSLAARIYVNDLYPLTKTFLEDTSKNFGAGAQTINVNEPEKSANIINKWVAEQTNNLIKNSVSKDNITPNTVLMLVNAIYFKGLWKDAFDPKNTHPMDFYVTPKDVQKADTMYQEAIVEFNESADLNCKILRLRYKNEKFSALITLPNKKDGVDDLLTTIAANVDQFETAIKGLRKQKVKIWLPKFKISSTINLKEIIPKLGITHIFTNQSGLTGILKSNESLYVSSAMQMTTIDVNEQGTEAAAVNVVGVSTTPVVTNQPMFNANHPFIFCIYHKDDIILSAVYRKPSKE